MRIKNELQHINLENIENPNFLKSMNYKEIDILCSDIRNKILETVSKNGGHLSSNLGVVEATVALCKSFDFARDKIIFDVGHQCYTYKILTGRKLDGLRKKDGISGFQKMNESPYDHYEAGHSSTSISAACGMATARDLNNDNFEIISFIGDTSIMNGLSFEGLNNVNGETKKHKIVIVLNDNEMGISKSVGGVSEMFRKFSNSSVYCKSRNAYAKIMNRTNIGKKIYDFTAAIKDWFKRHLVQMTVFDNLGYAVFGPIDGHNVKKMVNTFEKVKKVNKSCLVYLKTVKGKGYNFAENDVNGDWHGVGKFDIKSGQIFSDSNKISWSKHVSDILYDSMSKNKKEYTIVPGTLVGSCLEKVFKDFPDRCQDVGIAEEHAAILAAGLSVSGYHPVVSMYSTFLQRAYDEISHDLARLNLNSTILIDRGGLVGQDGNTHQGIYDESFLFSIPNIILTMPTNPSQTESLFEESLNNHGVFCIKYPRGSFLKTASIKTKIEFGEWISDVKKDADTAIISVGPLSEEIEKMIKEKKMNISLIKAIYIKPINENVLSSLLNYKNIIVYDPYSTINGFASQISLKLHELSYKGNLILKAIPNVFVDQASVDEQLESFGLLPSQIIKDLQF